MQQSSSQDRPIRPGRRGILSTARRRSATAALTHVNNAGVGVANIGRRSASNTALGNRAIHWGPGVGSPELETGGYLTTNITSGKSRDLFLAGSVNNTTGSSTNARSAYWNWNSGAITLLPSLLGSGGADELYQRAVDVNRSGVAIGFGYDVNHYQAVRWNTAGVPTLLQSSGQADTIVYDINESGVTLGYNSVDGIGTSLGGSRIVRWDANSATPVRLGTLGTDPKGYNQAMPVAINNAGIILGSMVRYDETGVRQGTGYRVVRYAPNSTIPIELTYGDGTRSNYAVAINEHGGVAGYTDDGTVLRWNANASATTGIALPHAGYRNFDMPLALNESGTIVGFEASDPYLGNGGGSGRAVIWGADNTATLLQTLLPADSGWQSLNEASSVADTGWVSGWGLFDPDGATGAAAAYPRYFSMLIPQAGTYGDGDGDFDGDVDFADLLLLAKHYGQSSGGSTSAGDFDLSGVTDFADLLALAKHYGRTSAADVASATSSAFAADWSLAQSLVPEPTSAAVVALATSTLATRQRRRR